MTTTETEQTLDLCEVCGGRGGDPEVTMTIVHDIGKFDDVKVRLCPECVATIVLAMTKRFNVARRADQADVAMMRRMFGMDDEPAT